MQRVLVTLLFLLCSIEFLGCSDRERPMAPEAIYTATLSDVTGQDNAHFYFLPPLGASISTTGTFDGTLSPTVEICAWNGSDCGPTIVEFTMNPAPGSQVVRVVPEDEHYIVNWHTRNYALVENSIYRITVLVDGFTLGHVDVCVIQDPPRQIGHHAPGAFPLVAGRTVPIKFRIEHGAIPETAVVCGEQDTRAVVLMVDPDLAASTSPGRLQFAADICADGYRVLETAQAFSSPPELRAYLRNLNDELATDACDLAGAILIGSHPRAYQFVVLSGWGGEEVISYQFYSDLNGNFASSPGYISPGGHQWSYDIHDGAVDWEIWIGVLPLYRGDHASTVSALDNYFSKNHQYRTAGLQLSRAFLQVHEHHAATTIEEHESIMNALRDGQYSWTPWSNAGDAHIYFDSTPVSMSVEQGYAALSDGVADFFVGDAHGYWGAHGGINISWVENNPVQTAFFWSNGCAVGNLEYTNNFLTALLYSQTSTVVLAKGTTNNSGGLGTNEDGFFGHNIATAMSQDHCIGQALVNHVNVPLRWPWSDSREFHFGTHIFLGDPTLRLMQ